MTFELCKKNGVRLVGMRRVIWLKIVCALATCAMVFAAEAFPPVPRASANALGVTKGKSFDGGIVFINGKFLPPPYVVERWGTGLRINRRKVSGEVIDWTEFLKTQSDVTVTRSASARPAVPEPVELAPEPGSDEDESDSAFDDLFDDDGKKKPKVRKTVRRPAVRKPTASADEAAVAYSLSGDFVPNEASKNLLARINATRTEIDRLLRMGGFVCFGDSYHRVSGDARTTERLLTLLPDIMQRSESEAAFKAAVREAKMDFLTESLCEDLYANRIDYRQLRERLSQLRGGRDLERTLGTSGAF